MKWMLAGYCVDRLRPFQSVQAFLLCGMIGFSWTLSFHLFLLSNYHSWKQSGKYDTIQTDLWCSIRSDRWCPFQFLCVPKLKPSNIILSASVYMFTFPDCFSRSAWLFGDNATCLCCVQCMKKSTSTGLPVERIWTPPAWHQSVGATSLEDFLWSIQKDLQGACGLNTSSVVKYKKPETSHGKKKYFLNLYCCCFKFYTSYITLFSIAGCIEYQPFHIFLAGRFICGKQ